MLIYGAAAGIRARGACVGLMETKPYQFGWRYENIIVSKHTDPHVEVRELSQPIVILTNRFIDIATDQNRGMTQSITTLQQIPYPGPSRAVVLPENRLMWRRV